MENLEITEDTTTSIEADLELISKPELNFNSSIEENIISLDHSFGFDCKKMYNLVLMDTETLVFASGNLIHFFNVTTSTVTTRRSAGGGGIGCIAKNPNPNYPHLTVGENGRKPTIYIYKFPEMELVAMLKKGTKRQFSFLDYTVDGELLASQGGDPDYLLTIWDWKRQEIKLRAKSFSNDVANLMFSPYIPDQLTTCGLGHIKFWKMSSTFTGLKLQGLIGRFGKTEICDIYGICLMPDEKVLSGCQWGNILVWENGLIKLEVCRKNRRKCHKGCITQIFMRNSEEIMTVGTDGYIRIWFWETVELSDPPEHDRFVEIEPSHEFHVGRVGYNAELLKIIKNISTDEDWYAQDGNGGIWWCDLATEVRPEKPKQLFQCHAGKIVAMDASSISHHVATLGEDGRLYVYDYIEKKMIFQHEFIAHGRDLLWLPASIDPTGAVMILGFSDGVVRVITFNYKVQSLEQFQLVQAVKCHCKPITRISINPKESIFVSASEDSTIFVHQLVKDSTLVTLNPIGFITVPSPVTCINWNPSKWSTVALGCLHGDVVQVDLPEQTNSYNDFSFHLDQILTTHFKFKSIKSQIRRHEQAKQIEARKEQKRQRKLRELERMKEEDPDLEINEEEFLIDSEDEEPLDPIHIPDPPSSILWIQFTSDNTLWLSVGGYDAGYIYEYRMEDGELLWYNMIPDADDIEIHTYMYFDKYLIFGMGDGKIRINNVKENWRDLTDFWQLSMHDNFLGKIPSIKFSFDNNYLFSIGWDGNLFSYSWNLPLKKLRPITPAQVPKLMKPVNDITDPKALSLEQVKEKEKEEKRREISSDNKNKVLAKIKELREEFDEIMKRNSILPESQKLKAEDLELDDRISDDLQERLDRQMDVVRRKKEFDFEKVKLAGKKLKEHFIDPIEFPIKVKGINNGKTVHSFRVRKLGETFARLNDEMEMIVKQGAMKRKRIADNLDISLQTVETVSSVPPVESFLVGLKPHEIETKLESNKMRRLLNKYRERKSKEVARKKEWQTVNAEKPNPDMDHPMDKKLIEEAKQTIGNYKLKTDPTYEPSENERESVEKKFSELIQIRKDVFHIREDYNKKIYAMREKKKNLIEFIQRKIKKLDEIHLEIPEKNRVKPKISVSFDIDEEFPERNLNLKKYLSPEAYIEELTRGTGGKAEISNPRDVLEKKLTNMQRIVLMESEKPVVINASPNFNQKTLKSATASTEVTSEWEDELKNLRVRRRLFEQNQILEKINQRIVEFDDEIDKLCDERYEVEVKAKFKDLFLLTLNHELMIIKDFEKSEEELTDSIAKSIADEKLYEMRIAHTQSEIEEFERNLEELNENKKELEQKFIESCLSNKFAPYFKKIFKRKVGEVQEVKKAHDEKEMSESGESSSGSSVSGSVKEFKGTMRNLSQDECPKNCDRKLYNLTFDLRREKYELEEAIVKRENDIKNYKNDLEVLEAQREQSKLDHLTNKAKLSELLQKKQTMLNDVDTVVILKMDQMQYFKNQPEFENINNTLLFNNNNVTKLYSRVGKLALETIEAKRKHRINVIHLAKMKTDIKFMEKQITDLKDGTNQAMMKKFGRVIDLNEVEETILRRFAFEMQVEMRANADDIKRQYYNKINELKKQKIEKEVNLNQVIQNATEKLNILTVLEEERNFLHRIISMQSRRKELKAAGLPYREIENDLSKLQEISNHQKEQIEMLQREIRALSLKTKTFVDTRQDFDSLNLTQLRGECRFDDSICSNPDESMLSSTRATTPDNEVYNEILKMVQKFAEENLASQIEETEISNISINVSKYLTNVALNFPSTEADEILPDIINDCQKFLPKHVHVGTEKIANLVAQAIGNFDESNEVSRCDVLHEIITNTIEATNQTAISSDSYLQHILTEIFKQMIITMRINEISSPECANEIVARLSKLNALNVRNIQIETMINDILDYASENMEDDVNRDELKRIISVIVTKLSV